MSTPVAPKQARSAARVERLLDAAEALVACHGAEGFPFSAVARDAGAAQGSLYRFFPSREAALIALHRRFAERAVATAEAVVDDLGAQDAAALPDRLAAAILRRFLPFYRGRPAYRVIRAWAAGTGSTAVEDDADRRIAALIAPALRAHAPALHPGRAERIAATLIEIADALLPLAEDAAGEDEAADALSGYLERALRRTG